LTTTYGADRMVTVNTSSEITKLIDEIKNDKTHGASELARQALNVLRIATERSQTDSAEQFLQELKKIGERLMAARPAMAPLFNIVSHWFNSISEQSKKADLALIKQLATSRADELASDSLQAVARIAEYGSELITNGDKIMTHSYSSTVVEVLKKAFTKHARIEVIATRSGPGHTGERIAQQLGLCGIPVTFIDDTAMGLYLPTVNKVMVGADRVCANGKIVNGIGTYQLALVAQRVNVPFYILCETLKFDSRLRGDQVELEEKEAWEVVEPEKLPPEVKIRNPYFDVTSLELVAGIVTENGLLMPNEVIGYMEKLPT